MRNYLRSDVTSRKPVNITSCHVLSTSRPANHAICSFIDSSGYASGPIIDLDYIINFIIFHPNSLVILEK